MIIYKYRIGDNMINKKGFTLVELLAVIVILGILITLGITTINRIIKNVSSDVFKLNEKNLALVAEDYYKMNSTLLPQNINSQSMVNLDALATDNMIKKPKNPDDETEDCRGYVVVTKTTAYKYTYDPYLKCGSKYITAGYVEGGPVLVP
jgi:prepilin-type N-terminal cleavage/methylation domain-containing protein